VHLLVVSYHHIGDEAEYAFPGIHPVSPAVLADGLHRLSTVFTFVSQGDVVAAARGRKVLPEYACLITFDDGLRSQGELAVPVLDRLGVPAVFFVNGSPYAEHRVLTVHKVQWLRSQLGAVELSRRLPRVYQDITGAPLSLESLGISDDIVRRQYSYDSLEEARLKFLLSKNVFAPALQEALVDELFRAVVADEAGFARRWYMEDLSLKDLARRGWLGLHTHRHRPLGALTDGDIADEIVRCRGVLAALTSANEDELQSLSYPYGMADQVSARVAAIAAGCGVRIAFTMERGILRSFDAPLLIPRLDANDIPGGKRPLIRVVDGGVESLAPIAGMP
jgi:peptidoglycan/xylan/chitin deacetylase (PgdA/CDA1 family)